MDDSDGWPHPRPPRRIAPLPPDQRSEDAKDLLQTIRARFASTDDMHLFATLAHHPRLFRRWSPFASLLLFSGELPPRERELLILRTAWNCRAHYEWAHHVPLAEQVGVTADEITAVTDGPTAGTWSDGDALLLRTADELHSDATISDGTWDELAAHYSPTELIEICMVVGQYHLVAFTVNALGIQLEPPASS